MLGGSYAVAQRRVHDHDPTPGGGFDLNVVDPDPCPSDHLELGGPIDNLGGDLGSAADDQSVVVTDRVGQFRGLQFWTEVEMELRITPEYLESLWCERIA